METNTNRLHPLLVLAAISLTVFSAVGIAALTGLIPHSKGSVDEPTPITAAQAPVTEPAPAPAPEVMPAPQPVKKHVAKTHAAPKVAAAEVPSFTPAPIAQTPPVYEAPRPLVKPGALGTVVAVREVEQKGDGSGVGAVGGGLAGAVLGHNIGDHNKLVTVLGAAGGALLGNQIEKQARATKHWELTVRYDDGTTQTFNSDAQPFWHQGDRVRLYEGKLQPV
ncbi:MAG TPA: glycine zipper 2TM domain-containing protein [Burkholderiales bacterium]|jgi:outer membrane lipoprotein SlyB